MITISKLTIYPVKSLKGIDVASSNLTSRGLQYDRRWMLIDSNGQFVSQRSYPILSQISVEIMEDSLHFQFQNQSKTLIKIPAFPLQKGPLKETQIWNDSCKALPVNSKADQWFSNILGSPVQLVYMPETSKRRINKKHGGEQDIVSYADGYPILIISEASLNDLNQKLESPIKMERFRPNIVVKGEEAFGEDSWKNFQISGLHFKGIKPCSRCIMITIDPLTGLAKSKEPLKTLSTYRKVDKKVLFGLNVIWEHYKDDEKGVLNVGDVVKP